MKSWIAVLALLLIVGAWSWFLFRGEPQHGSGEKRDSQSPYRELSKSSNLPQQTPIDSSPYEHDELPQDSVVTKIHVVRADGGNIENALVLLLERNDRDVREKQEKLHLRTNDDGIVVLSQESEELTSHTLAYVAADGFVPRTFEFQRGSKNEVQLDVAHDFIVTSAWPDRTPVHRVRATLSRLPVNDVDEFFGGDDATRIFPGGDPLTAVYSSVSNSDGLNIFRNLSPGKYQLKTEAVDGVVEDMRSARIVNIPGPSPDLSWLRAIGFKLVIDNASESDIITGEVTVNGNVKRAVRYRAAVRRLEHRHYGDVPPWPGGMAWCTISNEVDAAKDAEMSATLVLRDQAWRVSRHSIRLFPLNDSMPLQRVRHAPAQSDTPTGLVRIVGGEERSQLPIPRLEVVRQEKPEDRPKQVAAVKAYGSYRFPVGRYILRAASRYYRGVLRDKVIQIEEGSSVDLKIDPVRLKVRPVRIALDTGLRGGVSAPVLKISSLEGAGHVVGKLSGAAPGFDLFLREGPVRLEVTANGWQEAKKAIEVLPASTTQEFTIQMNPVRQ